MKQLLALIAICGFQFGFAQQTCHCETALSKVIFQIENDYPGFKEKTTDTLIYNRLKEQLITESKTIDESQCLTILKNFTSFFKDGHIWVLKNEEDLPVVKEANEQIRSLEINISAFKKSLKTSKDQIEGIWKDEGYTIGIKKTAKNQYTGFIIETDKPNWKPKQIKFQLNDNKQIDYYLSDHSLHKDTFSLHNGHLLHIQNIKANYVKQNTKETIDLAKVQTKINELDGFYFKQLTPKTSLIRLSSFNYPYVDRIENLIEENKAAIETSAHLIIDVRGNGGGTDMAYKKLIPYVTSNPIRNLRSILLSTQGLIDGVTTYRDGLMEKDAEKNKDEIKELNAKIELYKQRLGHYVNTTDEAVIIDSVEARDHSPKQIVILSDKKVGSAAENFILKAKQSKKVKVLGTPTAGVLDYANAYFFNFGCDNYKLLLPTTKSLRLPTFPIDNIGLQPDIYLDQSVDDWLKYAVDYLEN